MVQRVGYSQVIWEQPKESVLDAWVLYVFRTQPEKRLLLRWGIMQALKIRTPQSTAVASISQLALWGDS